MTEVQVKTKKILRSLYYDYLMWIVTFPCSLLISIIHIPINLFSNGSVFTNSFAWFSKKNRAKIAKAKLPKYCPRCDERLFWEVYSNAKHTEENDFIARPILFGILEYFYDTGDMYFHHFLNKKMYCCYKEVIL